MTTLPNIPLTVNLLFESSPDCAKILDVQGNLLLMNQNGQCLMELDDVTQVCGLPWPSLWPEESRSRIEAALEQARQGQLAQFVAFRPTAKGTPKWWDVRVTPIFDGEKQLQGFLSVSRDITALQKLLDERKKAETLSEGQKAALEQAVSGAPLSEVLDTLARAAEAYTNDGMLVSVLLLDDGHLRHGTGPSLPQLYTSAIDGVAIGPAVGSCGAAAYFNREIIVSDIANDPLWSDYKELALAHGLRSCWSQPIRSPQGEILGTLACYRREIHAPTEAEKEAVALLVNTAALILDHRREAQQRKATQDALRRNEQRFRSFVTATSQITWTTNAEGFVVEDSPSWRAFTGQTYEEWKHDGWLAVLHPDDRQPTIDAWRRSVARREIFETEYRIRQRDGIYRWTAARGVPVLNEDGSVREWVGANIDITERKRAEQELYESRERFQKIVSQAATGVVQTDTNHRIILVNQRFCDILGYSEAELLGLSLIDVTAEASRPQTKNAVEHAIHNGSGFVLEKQYQRKDGSLLWATASVNTLRGSAGEHQGLVAIVIDITDRKLAEDELRSLAAHLSEADHRKTEFLATLAHELRNPLAPIRNGLEVLRLAGNNPATAAKVQDMMQRQLNHMVHLINDLLDVARISSGKVELKKELVELKGIIGDAVESSLALIEAAHHTLDLRVPEESLVVHADPTRLNQVLGNLLTNAAKYTAEGGHIELSVHRDGQQVVISVSDTGIGIPAEALPTLFEMFTQVPNNAGRTQGGLGIGLSLVHRLVEMHGGTVTASSAGEGKGSTFIIRLPLVADQQGAPAKSIQDERTANKASRSLKVVIADDNRDAAESLATVLQLGGHKTVIAHDGYEALKQVQENQPEVVILDIGMPGLNGYEVARVIRKTPGLESTVLVALTGWGAQRDQIRAKEAGFDHHLTKPADIAAIKVLLTALTA
jgi:PAS domain S-box-containing protein